MTAVRPESHRTARLKLKLALLLATLTVGVLGCGDILGVDVGGDGGGDSLPPSDVAGVTAFGTVVRDIDGTTHARLDVLTLSGEPRFLSGIVSPILTYGDAEIRLTTGSTVGVFTTSSTRASALRYAANASYGFEFEIIDDAGTVHAYAGQATAPARTPIIEAATAIVHFAGEPVGIELYDMAEGGSLRVTNAAGEVTFDNTAISSLADVTRVRPAMEATVGPYEELPGTAFPTPGRYQIQVTSLNFADSVSGLGAASWFGAGSSTSLTITVD